jgi:hypothetical protein
MKINLSDGLYQVRTRDICAGFVVENRKVIKCAPILRSRTYMMLFHAVRISS